jgi:hypothetical protein
MQLLVIAYQQNGLASRVRLAGSTKAEHRMLTLMCFPFRPLRSHKADSSGFDIQFQALEPTKPGEQRPGLNPSCTLVFHLSARRFFLFH